MLDPQVATVLDEARASGPPPPWEVPVDVARAGYDAAAAALFGPVDPIHDVQDTEADGVAVRIYHPTAEQRPAVIFFHGGGWVNGSIESHDPLCRALAARSGAAVVSVGYRLAPEHVFPAAIEDAWKATRWARTQFPHLAVAGDSAGGQLAASVALRARDESLTLRLQALIYPVTDNAFDTESYREAHDPATLTEASMRWYWGQYLPETPHGFERDYAPLRAGDVDGVAPALIITAEYDPLRDEGEMYANRLKAARVKTTLTRYDGMVHGFIRWPGRVDAAGRAVDEVAGALKTALA